MTGEGGTLENVIAEANALSETLQMHRLEASESGALLARVLAEIDVAVLAFDDAGRLVVINHAGERLIGRPREEAIGKTAKEIAIAHFVIDSADTAVVASRWSVRRSEFRQGGVPHRLLVVSDLRGALREEERQAWERLLRVLGHELNSSLAPMKSVAESLIEMLRRSPRSPEWEEDARRGLQIIAQRSDALSRFLNDYGRVTRLPKPRFERVSIRELVEHVAALETRKSIEVASSEDVAIRADRFQLEQALINLVRNAVEATPSEGVVRVEWIPSDSAVEIRVVDDGNGVANAANLFVPFFTTKAGGSGIGLTLARQIVEAHDGMLTLENRTGAHGAIARMRLPLDMS
jgi:nitrogen fixation/metabolism regulation signal transduction histidine kinase